MTSVETLRLLTDIRDDLRAIRASLGRKAAAPRSAGETKPRGRPPADPRHRPMVGAFCILWTELRGGKYDVSPKDASCVSRFLRAHPDATQEEIERRMRLAFGDPWFAQNGGLAFFTARWSNFDRAFQGGRAVPESDRLRRFAGWDPETRKPVYAD